MRSGASRTCLQSKATKQLALKREKGSLSLWNGRHGDVTHSLLARWT